MTGEWSDQKIVNFLATMNHWTDRSPHNHFSGNPGNFGSFLGENYFGQNLIFLLIWLLGEIRPAYLFGAFRGKRGPPASGNRAEPGDFYFPKPFGLATPGFQKFWKFPRGSSFNRDRIPHFGEIKTGGNTGIKPSGKCFVGHTFRAKTHAGWG